jgi:hypothetical protein
MTSDEIGIAVVIVLIVGAGLYGLWRAIVEG